MSEKDSLKELSDIIVKWEIPKATTAGLELSLFIKKFVNDGQLDAKDASFACIDTLLKMAIENDYPIAEYKDLAIACFAFGAFLIKKEKNE